MTGQQRVDLKPGSHFLNVSLLFACYSYKPGRHDLEGRGMNTNEIGMKVWGVCTVALAIAALAVVVLGARI